jgi:hypothetical protein
MKAKWVRSIMSMRLWRSREASLYPMSRSSTRRKRPSLQPVSVVSACRQAQRSHHRQPDNGRDHSAVWRKERMRVRNPLSSPRLEFSINREDMPEVLLSASARHQRCWLREMSYLPFQALDEHRRHTRDVFISICDSIMLLAFEKNDVPESGSQ